MNGFNVKKPTKQAGRSKSKQTSAFLVTALISPLNEEPTAECGVLRQEEVARRGLTLLRC